MSKKGLTADERAALWKLRNADGYTVQEAITNGIPASMLVRLGNFDLVTMHGRKYVITKLAAMELMEKGK